MQFSSIVHNWLISGADPEVGFRLFMDYCKPNKAISRVISKDIVKHIQIVKKSLLKAANLPYGYAVASKAIPQSNTRDTVKVRDQWPFLADPECPPELKLLISDKITAYRNCVQEYSKLSSATNAQEQLNTTRSLVANFINNYNIYKELKYYKDNSVVLGEHSIFASFKRIKDLRNLSTMDLFKKKKNLEHAIWRNESKIKSEKREDLLFSRNEKIKELKLQLAEVGRLLL